MRTPERMLSSPHVKERDIPTQLAKSALRGHGAVHVVVARLAVEVHLVARPDLTAAAIDTAKDLFAKFTTRR
jgi:hypothetical protein